MKKPKNKVLIINKLLGEIGYERVNPKYRSMTVEELMMILNWINITKDLSGLVQQKLEANYHGKRKI